MHILIIPSQHFITRSKPFSGIFQLHQAKALHRSGHQVGIISPGFIPLRTCSFFYEFDRYENMDGIHVFRNYKRLFFPHRYTPFRVLKKKYERLGVRLFEEYRMAFGNPDIIHAHNFLYAGFIASRIKDQCHIPVVLTEHSTSFAEGKINPDLFRVIKATGENLDSINAVSSPFARLLVKKVGLPHVGLLPNMVDDCFVSSLCGGKKVSGPFTFLNIAGLHPYKNHEFLLSSFSAVFKSSNVILRIGGDGPLLRHLKTLAGKLQIEDQVYFLGKLNQSEVKEEMTKADCFVLPSKYETFGVVLIEALACGTPVIATRCGGPEDIVNDNNGILVDAGNSEQMCNALSYMVEHALEYHSENLRNEVIQKFGSGAFVTNVLKIYNKAVSSHGS